MKPFKCRGLAAEIAKQMQKAKRLPLPKISAATIEDLLDANIDYLSQQATAIVCKRAWCGEPSLVEILDQLELLIAIRLASVRHQPEPGPSTPADVDE